MPSHAWRRHHGPDILAEVAANGQGAWHAKVCLISNPTVSVTTPRHLDNLVSAQAKADSLARKTFDHRCDEACGAWAYELIVQ